MRINYLLIIKHTDEKDSFILHQSHVLLQSTTYLIILQHSEYAVIVM